MKAIHPKTWGILVLLVVLWGLLAILAPDSFLRGNNIENLLRRTAMHGLLGIAVSFVIITGGIDLSVGSLVGLAGCLFAVFLQVSYAPRTTWKVTEVDSARAHWSIEPHGAAPRVGEMLRYYGGRRAAPTTLNVRAASPQESQGNGPLLRIEGDHGANQDDSSGFLTPLLPLVIPPKESAGESNSGGTQFEVAGRLTDVRPGDRIWLVTEDGAVQEFTASRIEPAGERTRVISRPPIPDISRFVGVVPLARKAWLSLPAAVVAILILGCCIGCVHGTLVTKLGIQPFVVTLCGLLIYRGLARWLVDDRTMGFGTEYAESLGRLASGRWVLWSRAADGASFGIPYVVFLLLIVAISASLLLNRTIWGRYLFALGRNRDAACYAGIRVDQVTILGYVLCSALTVVGAIAFAADSNSIAPSSFGNFFELYAIAAAVLGGCSLRGGEGNIFGVVVGTALMQTLYNLIVLLKISDKLEFAVIGGVILLGVVADEVVRRWSKNR